ncbi:MAG: DNA primase, partial [Gemmatimonadales bacterium]
EQRVLVEAGLAAVRDDGAVMPRFRGRLLFPIHDLRGRPVAFGGRLLGPGEPKYLNSPENPIFHKGRQLYNLHLAKGAIRKAESVILVEGYFDVLRLVLAGVEHVVAPLGTSLTADQAALLKRFAPSATLLYDSDQAGLRATFRAGDELLRHGIRVRVATLPPGEDPDTLVKAGGAAALEPILRDAMDLIERKIRLLELKGWFEGVDHQREALDRLLPTIRAASDSLTKELYLSRVAERSGVRREALERELASSPKYAAPAPQPASPAPTRERQRQPAVRTPSTEARLLQTIFLRPELAKQAAQELTPELFERPVFREMFGVLTRNPEAAVQLPAELSEDGQRAWTLLKESAANVIGPSADDIFASSVQILVARPEYRKIHTLTDPGEKQRRRAVLRKQYPEADRWYEWKRLRGRKEA